MENEKKKHPEDLIQNRNVVNSLSCAQKEINSDIEHIVRHTKSSQDLEPEIPALCSEWMGHKVPINNTKNEGFAVKY